jgi:hypothetical protein
MEHTLKYSYQVQLGLDIKNSTWNYKNKFYFQTLYNLGKYQLKHYM